MNGINIVKKTGTMLAIVVILALIYFLFFTIQLAPDECSNKGIYWVLNCPK